MMHSRRFLKKIYLIIFLILTLFSAVYAAETDNRLTPIVKVVKDTAESVVNISTEHIVYLRQNPYWGVYGNDLDVLFNQFSTFHGMAPALKLKSVGSGVIVDKSGLIVTNAHVVNMASGIFVILNDGKQVQGELVYENKDDDLAFVKISPPKPLSQAVLGQTNDLMLGETVVAIGNPLGLENTVTSGILSGKNRKFHSAQGDFVMGDMLQIDAPINPGNSGGALFNLNSQLIGINVAVVEYSHSIGFAIPVEKLKKSMEEYKRNPSVPANLNKPGVEKGYVLRFDIAGLDKDKVKVEISNNLITLSGEYQNFQGAQAFGSFVKTIPLPQDADPQAVKTEIKDDTLIIHIARKNNK